MDAKHEDDGVSGRKRRNQLLEAIRRRWPDLFNLGAPVPLAVGIYDQLTSALPDVARADISLVLKIWTRRWAYTRAIAKGVERRNLDGSPAGLPDPTHIAGAKGALAAAKKRERAAREATADAQAAKTEPAPPPEPQAPRDLSASLAALRAAAKARRPHKG